MAVSISALAQLQQEIEALREQLTKELEGLEVSDVEKFKKEEAELIAQSSIKEEDCLPEWFCPIANSGEPMLDPVITVDGHTYERAEITKWFKTHNTEPRTRASCEQRLFRNFAIYAQIEEVLNPKLMEQKRTLQILVNEVRALKSKRNPVGSNEQGKEEETIDSISSRPSNEQEKEEAIDSTPALSPLPEFSALLGITFPNINRDDSLSEQSQEEGLFTDEDREWMGLPLLGTTISPMNVSSSSSGVDVLGSSSSSSSSRAGISGSSASSSSSSSGISASSSSRSILKSAVPSSKEVFYYKELQCIRSKLEIFEREININLDGNDANAVENYPYRKYSRIIVVNPPYEKFERVIKELKDDVDTALKKYQKRYKNISQIAPEDNPLTSSYLEDMSPKLSLEECFKEYMRAVRILFYDKYSEFRILRLKFSSGKSEEGIFTMEANTDFPIKFSPYKVWALPVEVKMLKELPFPGIVTDKANKFCVTFNCYHPRVFVMAAIFLQMKNRFDKYLAPSLSSSLNSESDRRAREHNMAAALGKVSSSARHYVNNAGELQGSSPMVNDNEVKLEKLRILLNQLSFLGRCDSLKETKYEKLRQNILDLERAVYMDMLKYEGIYIEIVSNCQYRLPCYGDVQTEMQNCLKKLKTRYTDEALTHIYTPRYELSSIFGTFESEVFSPWGVADVPQSTGFGFFKEITRDDGLRLQEEIDSLGIPGKVDSAMLHQYSHGATTIRGVRVIFDCDDAKIWNIAAAFEDICQAYLQLQTPSQDPQLHSASRFNAS